MACCSAALAALRRWFGFSDTLAVRNLNGEERTGTTRAWHCRGDHYTNGAPVPHFRDHSTYAVLTDQGWWANIAQGRIHDWSTKPMTEPIRASRWRVRGIKTR